MKKKMKGIVFIGILCGLAFAAVAQAGTNQTYIFQQGVDGYTGAEDVWLNALWANKDKNFGNYGTMLLHSSTTATPANITHTGAIKFDLSSIPALPPSPTITAKLILVSFENGWENGGTPYNVNLHKVLSSFNYGTGDGTVYGYGAVTYTQNWFNGFPANSIGWGTPPDANVQLGPVPTEDFSWTADATAQRTIETAGTQETLEFDVNDLVAFWLANPGQNHGVYVLPQYGDAAAHSISFFTSEAGASVRPRLEITITSNKTLTTLRQGVDGYLGCEDVYMNDFGVNRNYNYGGTSGMYTQSDPSIALLRDTAAIKFDLSSITLSPAQSIVDAKLYLYTYENGWAQEFDMGLHKALWNFSYGINDGFNPDPGVTGGYGWGMVTYNSRNFNGQSSEGWGNAANMFNTGPIPGDDFSWTPDATVWRDANHVQTLVFDVNDLVNFWVANPGLNFGAFIIPKYGDPNAYSSSIRTSENAEAVRPKLEITILEGDPTLCSEVWNFGFGLGGDTNMDCDVNFVDVAALADQFLNCSDPNDSACSVVASSYKILKVPGGGITVDGSGAEWPADSEWLPLDQKYFSSPSGPLPFDITSARFTLRWDDATDKIYALVEVRDTNQLFEDSSSGWSSSDRLEVYSQGDATGGTGWGAGGSKWYDVAQQYMVGPNTIATGGQWAFLFAGDPLPTGPNSPEFEYSVNVSGDLITYELGVKQFDHYGGISGAATVVTQLAAGTTVFFDIIADTQYIHPITLGAAFGMRSENLMLGKSADAAQFQTYELVDGPLACGDIGYFSADVTEDCVVDFFDYAVIANDWTKCNDPEDMPPCVATW